MHSHVGHCRIVLMMCDILRLHYRSVHSVCLWDEKGANKVHMALQNDILDFIKQAQNVSKNLHINSFVLVCHKTKQSYCHVIVHPIEK